MATHRIRLNELKTLIKEIINEEIQNKEIYLVDIDKYGVIELMDDNIVKYYIVSDSDGKRNDNNTYAYIRSNFDYLVEKGRIRML